MQKSEPRVNLSSQQPLFQVLNRHAAKKKFKKINYFLKISAIPKHKGKELKIDL